MNRYGDRDVQGEVPATYARLLSDYLVGQGLPPQDPSHIEGDRQQPDRLSIAQWRDWLTQASQRLQDPLLGLHLAECISPAHFGLMGYVLLACPNLAAALERMEKYHRLLYDVNPLKIQQVGQSVVLRWGHERGRPGALVDEAAIGSLIRLSRDLTGSDDAPESIAFVNAPPEDAAPYESWFRCPVAFAQEVTEVRFPLRFLARPLRQPDPALLALLEGQADRLLETLPVGDGFLLQVRRILAQHAPEGQISLEDVAERLALSPRTLHRRLEQHGESFRSLRDDTLRRIAEDHLANPQLQLADVALLLGYSEQSAFNRAFRRWTGLTPRAFRRGVPLPAVRR